MFGYRHLINKTSTMSENEGTTIGNLIYIDSLLCLLQILYLLKRILKLGTVS